MGKILHCICGANHESLDYYAECPFCGRLATERPWINHSCQKCQHNTLCSPGHKRHTDQHYACIHFRENNTLTM